MTIATLNRQMGVSGVDIAGACKVCTLTCPCWGAAACLVVAGHGRAEQADAPSGAQGPTAACKRQKSATKYIKLTIDVAT